MLNYLRSSVYALTVPLIFTLSVQKSIMENIKEPDLFTCLLQLLPVHFKDARSC